jgi:hypothetical protein
VMLRCDGALPAQGHKKPAAGSGGEPLAILILGGCPRWGPGLFF